MSTLKFKSEIEVPGIHLKGKDKNGSDIGTQVRVNSISLYADNDSEQLDMSASHILQTNEIDGYHTTKITPDLIELISEDSETGQETATSITSAGIATNNITRQNTSKSITIDSTSSTPVVADYISTKQVTLSNLNLVHKNGNIELQSGGILIDTVLTNTNIPEFVDASKLNAGQSQITETISGYLNESMSTKLWVFSLPVNYELLTNYTLHKDAYDPYTYTKHMTQGNIISYMVTAPGGVTIEEDKCTATLLITYTRPISIQEALDSMERVTYRYRSNKWVIPNYNSAEFGMLIATVPKSYGTTIQDIALHEHWGFFYSKNQPMLPCRVSTNDDNQPYLMMYPNSASALTVEIDIPEEEGTTTYLEFVNQ